MDVSIYTSVLNISPDIQLFCSGQCQSFLYLRGRQYRHLHSHPAWGDHCQHHHHRHNHHHHDYYRHHHDYHHHHRPHHHYHHHHNLHHHQHCHHRLHHLLIYPMMTMMMKMMMLIMMIMMMKMMVMMMMMIMMMMMMMMMMTVPPGGRVQLWPRSLHVHHPVQARHPPRHHGHRHLPPARRVPAAPTHQGSHWSKGCFKKNLFTKNL